MKHTKRRAALLLNTVMQHQYHELCELLGGFNNAAWRELVFGNGEPRLCSPEPWLFLDGAAVGETYDYAMVRRTHYDGDYYNYVLAQVSDRAVDGGEWQFVLFHNSGANDWVPEQVYSWGYRCPSEGEAGAMVDEITFLSLASER